MDRRTSVLMRRLRENTMLETEISKTGEVMVEGHAIGRLDGFMFAADASAGGSEAKALHAARAEGAGRRDRRARDQACRRPPDEQFVLASDGTLRWIGDVVGKLVAGDDVLRPRLRIIADEHLTGPAREAVQARLDLWLKTHIEKLLAPLFALAAAEDVTGIARGIAFQLVEALGVLERQKVAEEVKGLDQPARATLRNYGVRFGAYHIYMPTLLKPAPRALAAQLWALKHGSRTSKGSTSCSSSPPAAALRSRSTRKSPKTLYRTVGYRVCGERAVRVDILERLADLIRPALSWRESARGAKPPGAFDGTRLHRHRRDDVAHRRVGRGFRLDPALARLSHGAAAQAAGAEQPRDGRDADGRDTAARAAASRSAGGSGCRVRRRPRCGRSVTGADPRSGARSLSPP